MSPKKKLLGVNFPIDQIPEVERRKDELGFKTLSDYLKDLISRDLTAPPEPAAVDMPPAPPPAPIEPSPPILSTESPPLPKAPWLDSAVLAMWFIGVLPFFKETIPVDVSEVTRKYVELPRNQRFVAPHHRLAFRLILTDFGGRALEVAKREFKGFLEDFSK